MMRALGIGAARSASSGRGEQVGRGSRIGRSGRRAGSRRQQLRSPAPRTAGRRRSLGAVLTVLVTLAVAIGSYTVSARVSAERQAAEELASANAALARQVHALGQELRVRMRLPQLQSWNETTFRMQPASARQLLGGTAELAVYAIVRPQTPAPVLVAADAPLPTPLPALPRLAVETAPTPAPAPAPLQAAPAPPAARPAPGLVLASVGAIIDAAIADTPEEGSGLPPAELAGASAPLTPIEP